MPSKLHQISELNVAKDHALWQMLISTALNKLENRKSEISPNAPWYLLNFTEYLRLLDFKIDTVCKKPLNVVDYKNTDWSFLKSNRYQDSEVFKDQKILIKDPSFLCVEEKCLVFKIDTNESYLAQVVYDYYRRFIPVLYSFLKVIRSQQRMSLNEKIPFLELFFSNFGDTNSGLFNENIPIDDPLLKSIIKQCFENYHELSSQHKYGRAITQLNDLVRGIAEYLKIITTVNYLDLELINFLHKVFLGENFEKYELFFKIAQEDFLLNNISWTYTKAYQINKRLF